MNKIKEKIKNTKFYYKYLLIRNRRNARKDTDKIKSAISKTYKKTFGYELDWENPKTYNEKINVSKLFYATDKKAMLSDKILVRDWIRNKIGDEYLIPILGIYDNFEDIDFSKLPEKFVMKMNNDSGSVFVCKDKRDINLKILKNKYLYFTKRNYAYEGYEMHYKDIKPKIVIEKFMGNSINDYKFQCFNGNVICCRVDYDRFRDHRRNFYDLNWNILPFNKGDYTNTEQQEQKPNNFNKMVEIAKNLSNGFDQVRVDLYNIGDRIYFGEMTFTNGNGMEKIDPYFWDEKLGKMWELKL